MPLRDAKHLSFIRLLPCVKGGTGEIHAAHIRTSTDGGMGMKPSDFWVLPLSASEHHKQHQCGERQYYGGDEGIEKAKHWAKELYAVTGDIFKGQRVSMKARKDMM